MHTDILTNHRVRIVATIGPASRNVETLIAMIEAGMNVARLNFSHGSYEDHAQSVTMIRRAADQVGVPIAILQDLQGVKIRTGLLQNGKAELKSGQTFILTSRDVPGDEKEVSISWPSLPRDVKKDHILLLDDGRLSLRVIDSTETDIRTVVEQGGILLPHKGINLPGTRLAAPSLTEKDLADLAFGLQQDVDAVAISFVRRMEDVARVRQAIIEIDRQKSRTPVIAKLERREALDQLDAILDVADGVMVARGDLGVET
jgi:pyruvate kinase